MRWGIHLVGDGTSDKGGIHLEPMAEDVQHE